MMLKSQITKITLGVLCAGTLLVAGCATSSDGPSMTAAEKSQPVKTAKAGSKEEKVIYANSSAELAKRFVGKHIDELPEATSSHKAVEDGNKVICKVVKRTHTRLREKKICAPRKEWDLYKSEAARLTRQKQITRRAGD